MVLQKRPYSNQGFQWDENTERRKISFADVVTTVIREPIREDSHPFGRGHLYSAVADGPRLQRGAERFIMWFMATLVLAGIAVSVIIMSRMIQRFLLFSYRN